MKQSLNKQDENLKNWEKKIDPELAGLMAICALIGITIASFLAPFIITLIER